MKTVSVRQLAGHALNYATALADGYEAEWLVRNSDAIPDYCGLTPHSGHHFLRLMKEYSIDVLTMPPGRDGWVARSSKPARSTANMTLFYSQSGKCPCEALARTLVSMNIGNEVAIPEKFL